MKKNYFSKFILFGLLFLIGISANYGQTTVSYDFSDGGAVSGLNEASPGISLDANIGFGSFRNSGTSNPGIFSSQLRLYQNATKGGSIIIYASNGVTITNIVVNASSRTGPAGYTVDGGSEVTLSGGSTYTISGISATSQVEFFQRDASSSNRIYIDSFDVTYTTGGSPTPGITLGAVSGNTTEAGGTATFTVVLDAEPATDVVVDVSSGDTGEVTVNSPTSLTFTNANWDTTQTVTVTGVDDMTTDGNVDVTITVAVNDGSSDDDYDGISTSTTVTNEDDDLPAIVISEIMYNSTSTDDEWIEIYNGNGSSVDVSNWTIEYNSSTVFTFPGSTTISDGDYITVALGSNGDGTYNNENPFTPDYSSVSDPVADTNDTNNLGNTSGTITLKNSGGSTIDEVAYDDGDASSTDGSGPSYELTDVTADNSATSSNWQASAFNGGSPGKVNTTTWSGATDNDWDTGSNWSAGVPSSTSDILIPGSLTNYPTASGAVTINTAIMNSGSSLIASSTFSGTITYNRNLGTSNWYLVGAPVAGETIEDMISNNTFDTGTVPNIGLAPYDNTQVTASDRWDYQTAASTGSLTSGGGYSVKLASAGDLAFTGTMETADVGVSIAVGAGNAFNLVGNPYPSYIAANTNADGTNNLLTVNTADLSEETLWLWDQGTNSYDAFNQASAALHIAPGQGFFVSAGGSNTFDFTEAMQSHQGTDSFQRTTTNNRPEINLVITDGTDTRDADIFYIAGTTTGFDNGYDSSMFSGVGNSFAIYTHLVSDSQGQNLEIQSLPDNDFENMVIPVGVNATSGTEITISAGVFNLPADINVYLEDKTDNSFTLLDSSSDFTKTLNSDLNGIGRFYLHTSSRALSVDNINNTNNISIYTFDNDLRVVGVQNGTANVSVYNILGKEVLRTSFEGNGVNDVTLPNLKTGIYVVQLATETGTMNKKVIIE